MSATSESSVDVLIAHDEVASHAKSISSSSHSREQSEDSIIEGRKRSTRSHSRNEVADGLITRNLITGSTSSRLIKSLHEDLNPKYTSFKETKAKERKFSARKASQSLRALRPSKGKKYIRAMATKTSDYAPSSSKVDMASSAPSKRRKLVSDFDRKENSDGSSSSEMETAISSPSKRRKLIHGLDRKESNHRSISPEIDIAISSQLNRKGMFRDVPISSQTNRKELFQDSSKQKKISSESRAIRPIATSTKPKMPMVKRQQRQGGKRSISRESTSGPESGAADLTRTRSHSDRLRTPKSTKQSIRRSSFTKIGSSPRSLGSRPSPAQKNRNNLFTKQIGEDWSKLSALDKFLHNIQEGAPDGGTSLPHAWRIVVRKLIAHGFFNKAQFDKWGGLTALKRRYELIRRVVQGEHAKTEPKNIEDVQIRFAEGWDVYHMEPGQNYRNKNIPEYMQGVKLFTRKEFEQRRRDHQKAKRELEFDAKNTIVVSTRENTTPTGHDEADGKEYDKDRTYGGASRAISESVTSPGDDDIDEKEARKGGTDREASVTIHTNITTEDHPALPLAKPAAPIASSLGRHVPTPNMNSTEPFRSTDTDLDNENETEFSDTVSEVTGERNTLVHLQKGGEPTVDIAKLSELSNPGISAQEDYQANQFTPPKRNNAAVLLQKEAMSREESAKEKAGSERHSGTNTMDSSSSGVEELVGSSPLAQEYDKFLASLFDAAKDYITSSPIHRETEKDNLSPSIELSDDETDLPLNGAVPLYTPGSFRQKMEQIKNKGLSNNAARGPTPSSAREIHEEIRNQDHSLSASTLEPELKATIDQPDLFATTEDPEPYVSTSSFHWSSSRLESKTKKHKLSTEEALEALKQKNEKIVRKGRTRKGRK